MTNIPFVKRKVGETYLVWFQNSNLYFQLEEPAWFVFSRLADNGVEEIIVYEFSERYEVALDDSRTFVEEIRLKAEEMNQSSEPYHDREETIAVLNDFEFESHSTFKYELGDQIIQFVYGTPWLEKYIHPLIEHLETLHDVTDSFLFELFYWNECVVFRFNKQIKGIWRRDESHFVKGKIFLELINVLHKKTDADWLMTVHASAITNGRKTILFSAEPGSGKTTMAALLQAKGYHLISDDFVPFDKYSIDAYPFPIAMSVKEGSMELLTSFYPELEGKAVNRITSEKSVRYLPIENEMMKMVFPVQEIIFIKYDDTIDFKLEKLDPVVALKLLLDQIWVPPAAENVETLFDRIFQFSFYQLTYSHNEKALKAIGKLFGDE